MNGPDSSIQSTHIGPAPVTASLKHVFTVDVEDYFQVSAFDATISRSAWETLPSRLEYNVDRLLDLLDAFETKATFFTLGWVAARHPRVVQRIAAAGHEIASHGWWHLRVSKLTSRQFREEVRNSKLLLEDVSGHRVIGFRAPSFSIRRGMEWTFDVLLEEGYAYDSSLFPIRRPDYGYPGIPDSAHPIERASGVLIELPLTTVSWLGTRLPACGGAYLRHLPMIWTDRAFAQRDRCATPVVLYIHPWELDPDQPRMSVGMLTRLRHYVGLTKTVSRLKQLLDQYSFTTAADSLGLRSRTDAARAPLADISLSTTSPDFPHLIV